MNDELHCLRNGRRPEKVRDAPIAFESPLLDSLKTSRQGEASIDESKSIRENKQQLHIDYLRLQRMLDLQMLEEHTKNLRELVKRDAFVDRCLAHSDGQIDASERALTVPHAINPFSLVFNTFLLVDVLALAMSEPILDLAVIG